MSTAAQIISDRTQTDYLLLNNTVRTTFSSQPTLEHGTKNYSVLQTPTPRVSTNREMNSKNKQEPIKIISLSNSQANVDIVSKLLKSTEEELSKIKSEFDSCFKITETYFPETDVTKPVMPNNKAIIASDESKKTPRPTTSKEKIKSNNKAETKRVPIWKRTSDTKAKDVQKIEKIQFEQKTKKSIKSKMPFSLKRSSKSKSSASSNESFVQISRLDEEIETAVINIGVDDVSSVHLSDDKNAPHCSTQRSGRPIDITNVNYQSRIPNFQPMLSSPKRNTAKSDGNTDNIINMSLGYQSHNKNLQPIQTSPVRDYKYNERVPNLNETFSIPTFDSESDILINPPNSIDTINLENKKKADIKLVDTAVSTSDININEEKETLTEPVTKSTLVIQLLPKIDIKRPLVKQTIPAIVIRAEDTVIQHDYIPDNIKYVEVKHEEERILNIPFKETPVIQLETIEEVPENVENLQITSPDIESPKEDVQSQKTATTEGKDNVIQTQKNPADSNNVEVQDIATVSIVQPIEENQINQNKTIYEELNLDIDKVPSVRTLKEIQNYLETRCSIIKTKLAEQKVPPKREGTISSRCKLNIPSVWQTTPLPSKSATNKHLADKCCQSDNNACKALPKNVSQIPEMSEAIKNYATCLRTAVKNTDSVSTVEENTDKSKDNEEPVASKSKAIRSGIPKKIIAQENGNEVTGKVANKTVRKDDKTSFLLFKDMPLSTPSTSRNKTSSRSEYSKITQDKVDNIQREIENSDESVQSYRNNEKFLFDKSTQYSLSTPDKSPSINKESLNKEIVSPLTENVDSLNNSEPNVRDNDDIEIIDRTIQYSSSTPDKSHHSHNESSMEIVSFVPQSTDSGSVEYVDDNSTKTNSKEDNSIVLEAANKQSAIIKSATIVKMQDTDGTYKAAKLITEKVLEQAVLPDGNKQVTGRSTVKFNIVTNQLSISPDETMLNTSVPVTKPAKEILAGNVVLSTERTPESIATSPENTKVKLMLDNDEQAVLPDGNKQVTGKSTVKFNIVTNQLSISPDETLLNTSVPVTKPAKENLADNVVLTTEQTPESIATSLENTKVKFMLDNDDTPKSESISQKTESNSEDSKDKSIRSSVIKDLTISSREPSLPEIRTQLQTSSTPSSNKSTSYRIYDVLKAGNKWPDKLLSKKHGSSSSSKRIVNSVSNQEDTVAKKDTKETYTQYSTPEMPQKQPQIVHRTENTLNFETASNKSSQESICHRSNENHASSSNKRYSYRDRRLIDPISFKAKRIYMKQKKCSTPNTSVSESSTDDVLSEEISLSDGEVKLPCKCSTSIGEIHLCRFANDIRKKVEVFKQKPEKMLRECLDNNMINVKHAHKHYDNWVSYYVSRSRNVSSGEIDSGNSYVSSITTSNYSEQ